MLFFMKVMSTSRSPGPMTELRPELGEWIRRLEALGLDIFDAILRIHGVARAARRFQAIGKIKRIGAVQAQRISAEEWADGKTGRDLSDGPQLPSADRPGCCAAISRQVINGVGDKIFLDIEIRQ